jgi:molybdate-binding protein
MNDNEPIKALEYCLAQGITSECEKCTDKIGCRDTLLHNALDFIKRKNTEIDILIRKKEALKDEIAELKAEVERLKEIEFMYNELCR